MEIYQNLNWARKTHRSPKQQFDLFNCHTFGQEDDVFYQNLNEIDSIFVDETSPSTRSKPLDEPPIEDNDDEIIIDPRTNKPIDQLIYDHTLHKATTNRIEIKYFDKFPRNSTISKKNHKICIRAISLLNLTNHELTESEKQEIEIYQKLESFRLEEKKQFHIFVQNHFNAFFVSRFSKVDDHFKNFLLKYKQHKIRQWTKFCGHKNYVLQTSFPNKAAAINDEVAINFVKIVHKTGIVPFKLNVNKPSLLNCTKSSKLNVMYLDPESIKFEPVQRDPNIKRIINELDENVDFAVHFSSLIYLMDTTLNSWNIQMTVQETEKGKCVFIEKCLPRSDLTTIDMIKRGYKYALKYSTLNYHNKASYNLDEDRVCGAEIKLDYQSIPAWKLQTCDNYLENVKFSASVLKPNLIYSLFNLTDEKLKFASNLLVRSKYDAREQQEAGTGFTNLSSKIEFQSEFGAEIMTKTELIKEWLKQCINVETVTKRIRIDSETGIIVSQKLLNLTDIENDLKRLYNLTPKSLLNNLIAKLDLIGNRFPLGEYLMQYNAALYPHVKIYKLQSAIPNITDNVKLLKLDEYLAGINLYNLDNNFIQYPSPNQIDDMEITLVHRRAGIIPCGFLYVEEENTLSNQVRTKLKKQKSISILDEKKRFNEKRQWRRNEQDAFKNAKRNKLKRIKRDLRFQKKAEHLRLLEESREQEAREQRQFEWEYNIHGMFDEHGNVRTKPVPVAAIELAPPMNITQSYQRYESSAKQQQKLNTTPKSSPLPLPTNQDINKTNYSILTLPPSSSSSSFTAVPSVESDNDLKIEKTKNDNKSKANTNKTKVGKQTAGNSLLGSIRKSIRVKTVNNKNRYF